MPVLVPVLCLSACSRTAEPEEPPAAVLSGTVTDADTGMPLPLVMVSARLTQSALGDSAGQAITSSAGAYRITRLDGELEHVVVARTEGFDGATATLLVRAGDNVQDLALRRTRVCTPASKRCTVPPAAAALLTCNALGTAYDVAPCAAGEVCSLATVSCGNLSQVTVEIVEAGGTGQVTSAPAGIVCPPDCSETFAAGTAVTLTAAASGEAALTRFEGACTSVGSGPCTFTTAGSQTVRARFEGTGPSVTVRKTGLGSATVVSSPAGIDCGGTCVSRFGTSERVTLAATLTARSVFVGWTGCEPANQLRCQLTAAQGAVASLELAAFFERQLTAEAGCVGLYHFNAAQPWVQGCGGGPPAVATGTVSIVASRNGPMGQAFEAVGPREVGAIDTLKPGLTTGRRTVEMSVQRLGNAFEGRTRGTLYSDRASPTAPGVMLVVHDDGRLVGTTRDAAGAETTVASMPGAVAVGQWRHVELMADAEDGLRLKVDAMLVGETMGAPAWTTSSTTAWLGATRAAGGGSTDRFNGRLDEVRFGDYGRN